jgi:hypothetical protein
LIEASNLVVDKGKLVTTVGPSGSGSGHSIKCCERCGDKVFSNYAVLGTDQIIFLKTTTLDNAESFPPLAHIFTKDKLSWVELGTAIPSFDEGYDRYEVYSKRSLARRSKFE